MVAAAETFLTGHGFKNVRVRLHTDELARVEVPADALDRFADEGLRMSLVETLREAGFRFVTLDLEGFASGSLNRVL